MISACHIKEGRFKGGPRACESTIQYECPAQLQDEDVASSKLGEIKPVNGNTETELSVKYTMFSPVDTPQFADPAGKTAEAFKSVSGMKGDVDEFAPKTLPAADGVVTNPNTQKAAVAKAKLGELSMTYLVKSSELSTQLKEPALIEFPNLTSAQKAHHNQTGLESLVTKKTEPKE